ncbi:MAG: hypothetical protein LQ338_005706 [Usnochroma carphineum]|nr:MAG: hypothetical protein LQ338_005706 [Usnochroma carphineum]
MACNAVSQVRSDTPSSDADWRSSPSLHDLYQNSTQQLLSNDMDLEMPVRPSMTRVSSTASTPLRHPTPDLQSLQGAYLSNVERLEQSAERLSMGGSDMGEELRKIRMEQKRSESRRSSLINARSVEGGGPSSNRQVSYGPSASSSIAGLNSIARSGGFSPEGYFASPRGSIRSGSWSRRSSTKARSASNESRFAQVLDSTDMVASPTNVVKGFPPTLPSPQSSNQVLQVTNGNGPDTTKTGNLPSTRTSPQPTPEPAPADLPRPSSADTYRQAQAAALFADFAGVHTATHEAPTDTQTAQDDVRPRQSSNRISSGGRPKSFLEPVPGEDMVYYPAPVPMMLNLPQKLSEKPRAPQIDKRRSAMLSGLDPHARKSAVWLPDVVEGEDGQPAGEGESLSRDNPRRKTVGNLPPQLRASLFFDYPSLEQDVEMKGGSAVETLDSILNASAFAPVSAFTDHPIAGRVGKEVYGKAPPEKRASYMPLEQPEIQTRRSSINLLKKRNSSSNLLDDTQRRHSSLLSLGFGRRKSRTPQLEDEIEDPKDLAGPLPSEVAPFPNGDEVLVPEEDGEGEFFDARSQMDGERADEESELISSYNGAPTTLLAELQLRKEQQKQRNRTAAMAFPNGMHSTLLELDAVAQIQKQARTKKHTHLAWEDPDAQHPGAENDDDEDVPLGVLFPGRKPKTNGHHNGNDDDRPLGLIARRAMEDNEPLSHRRARLRGEPSIRRAPSPDRKGTMYTLDLPALQNSSTQLVVAPDDDVEGETLAQRLKRLKATRIPSNDRTVSGDFTSEILSQFGGLDDGQKQPPPPSRINNNNNNHLEPEQEEEQETLAERRARLQAERTSRDVSGESNGVTARPALNHQRSMADLLQAHPAAGAGSRVSSNDKVPLPSSAAPKTPWTMQVQQRALSGELPAGLGGHNGVLYPRGTVAGANRSGVPNPLMFNNGNAGSAMLDGLKEKGVGEVRSRDMIDRWRQSVMY